MALVLLLQLMAGLAGWWWQSWPGAVAGVALAGLAAAALQLLRGRRFLKWIREPASGAPRTLHGQWGDAAYRTARALRMEQDAACASEERLHAFLSAIQASPNGVVVLAPDGRIEWFNDMASAHFGFVPQRDLLQHIGNLVRDPAFTAYFNSGAFKRDVRIAGREDSPARPVRLSVQIHPYGDNHKLLLSRDITALSQAEAMRRDFVANVSHEIRTPLTVLAGFVETLQSLNLSDAEREHYLALMATQADRMQTLVKDLLMLSRLEGSPLPDSQESIDLGALMAECEAEARGLSELLHADDAGQSLQFDPAPPFRLSGSASELRSAVSNLINNAVRYTPAGGSIHVRWERTPAGHVRLAVTDTGAGIAPQHLARIGERFYRVDRSRSRESGGTGLGLAIAKHVAQRHGGELQAVSELGKGSTFSLVFPDARVRPLPGAAITPAA
ncbi:phosphate regulon sensor histidine kinase PhoR [Ottowia flava]|uniref:Phosphate regulon sensor protein PhoR n=1 Tax=Ottowia flava TaxID=2675430 RepID=A0ABW4KV82_9BURK